MSNLVLYTEEQLMRAYKIYVLEYCTPTITPDIETFRDMFEESEEIQNLADRELHEN